MADPVHPTALVSWAHREPGWTQQQVDDWSNEIADFVTALRGFGVDAQVDLHHASERGTDWTRFGPKAIKNRDWVIVALSPAWRDRWEGTNAPTVGAGVVAEADALYSVFAEDQQAFRDMLVLVTLPSMLREARLIPTGLHGVQWRAISGFDLANMANLLRLLTGQGAYPAAPLGDIPELSTSLAPGAREASADVSGNASRSTAALRYGELPLSRGLTKPTIPLATGDPVPIVDPAVGSAPLAVFVLPDYSGDPWAILPNLKRRAGELAALFEAHGTQVRSPTFASVAELDRTLDHNLRGGREPLLVYVGGHGIIHAGRHYTALDTTPPHSPSAGNALSSVRLAELLTGGGRDVLIVLDSSFAGQGAVGMIGEAVSAQGDTRNTRAFGVLASCGTFHRAEDGLFIEKVLELVRSGPLHDVNAWGPGDERIRMGALVSELEQAGLQVVSGNLGGGGELRLVPNPRWDACEPEGRVDAKSALRRLSRDARVHLVEKSTGFVGRVNVRRKIVTWLASEPRGTFVVTGGPGTGKSALMGLLARQSVGEPSSLEKRPALKPGTFDVIVHARQKTLEAVRAELSTAVSGDVPATVLIDALDEAVAGEAAGIAAHLASLARRGAAVIVVGTRPGPVVASGAMGDDSLLRELDPQLLYRLDDPHDDTTSADIAEMVRAQLLEAQDSPYRATDVPVDEIARLTASVTTPSFLFAQASARWLCSRDGAISDEPGWRQRLTRSTGEAGLGRLVEDDLAVRFPDDLERVRDLLRAAAWAEGLGLPRYTIWPSFADELSPTGTRYSDPDVTWLLNEAGWYLIESSEDGQSVYRLFHQALADYFRADTPGELDEVQGRLAARLHRIAMTAGGWERAGPYVLHYLIAHAEQSAEAGDAPSRASTLLREPGFVAHAHADRLARAVRRLRGRIRGPLGPSLKRCVHLLDGLDASQRLALLKLTALQEQLADSSPAIARSAVWWPLWAHWRPSAPHVTLIGHDGWIWSVGCSSDGATLASAGADGTVRLWDATTGEPRPALTAHDDWVWSVGFSSDGAILASGGADRTIRLWDVATGEPTQTLAGHPGPVLCVVFSPDGVTLASAGDDGAVRLWDVASGTRKQTVTGHEGPVRSIVFSPEGATLASAGDDGTLRLWDVATGTCMQTVTAHDGPVRSIVFSPDGTVLASASDDRNVRIWDRITGEVKQTLIGHGDWVSSVAFSPDGALLASASADCTLRLWDTMTGELMQTLTGHDGWVLSVVFSSDGATLASAGADRTLRLWDVTIGEFKLQHRTRDDSVLSVVFSPDGATLVGGGDDGTVKLWDAVTGEAKQTMLGHGSCVWSLVFSPDGARLASASEDGTARLWDCKAGRSIEPLVGHDGAVLSVAFSPGGAMLATAGSDGTLRHWNAATGEPEGTLRGHDGPVRSVVFSPDGATMASASDDGTIRLWDTGTGTTKQTFTDHDGPVLSVAVSPDGRMIASAGADGALTLRDIATGEFIKTLTGHEGAVLSIVFSTDGTMLASAGDDSTVRLWDAATGAPFGLVHARSVCKGVAWSRHNRLAVAAKAGIAIIGVR
jgi:WD40 repeat protein